MPLKCILFDLDGTLTESAPGIINSIEYTYRRYGLEIPDRKELEKYVGPPLIESFMKYAGFDPDRAREAVDVYREYFSEKGIFENNVYPGVRECLERLLRAGYRLAVSTSKPEVYCLRILEKFDLRRYFEVVKGIPLDGEDIKKSEVIKMTLESLAVTDPAEAVMVGDRDYDVYGAAENGIRCAGVLYGYGTLEELKKAGAFELFKTPSALSDYFCK